jgi:hypothetical protein
VNGPDGPEERTQAADEWFAAASEQADIDAEWWSEQEDSV